MKNKKLRLLVAVLTSSLVWAVLVAHTVHPHHWTLNSLGAWIPVHPPPLEIIFLTICAVVITELLYWWYRYDRVKRFASTIDAEEREHLLDLLIDQHLHDTQGIFSVKHKRLANDGEIIAGADREVAAGQAR